MHRFVSAGICGRLCQIQREGAAVTFPRYVTQDGKIADRAQVFVSKVRPKDGIVEVLVKKSGNNYNYRTMRIDRIRKTEMVINGRRRKRYFVSTKTLKANEM